MADELIAGRRIARRRLFLCDLGPVVRLPVFDVRTLPEEVASYDAIPLAGIKPLSIRLHVRSEEHTSELQSQSNLVCRLLLEKKKKHKSNTPTRFIAHLVCIHTISPTTHKIATHYFQRTLTICHQILTEDTVAKPNAERRHTI